MMFRNLCVAAVAATVISAGQSAATAGAISGTVKDSYYAYDVPGNQADPEYGLRLDGFFNGSSSQEVTFSFQNGPFDAGLNGGENESTVAFQTYDTTSDGEADRARLWGYVKVVEVNNAPPSASQTRTYLLDVEFDKVIGVNPWWSISGGTATDPGAPELVNIADPNDTVQLIGKSNGTFEYTVEYNGAGKNTGNFGARGWVMYSHDDGSSTTGSLTSYITSSDFLMDLEDIGNENFEDPTVPEPASLAVFATLGLLGFAGVRRNRRKNG